MSIIPNIPRPTIAPNRFAEIPFLGSLFIDAATTIHGSGRFIRLYWANNNPVSTVRVDGMVWAAMSGNVSSAITGFNIGDFVINGTVGAVADVNTSEFRQANAYGVTNAALGRSVTNNGTIYAYTNGGIAHALAHSGPDVMITNNGLIAAQTGTLSEPAASQALGIYMVNGGFVHNTAGGRILAEGVNATGIIMGRGDFGVGAGTQPNILNDGTIQAVSIAGSPSVGILFASLSVETVLIRNNGLIAADVAIRTGSATWPVSPSDATIENGATGTIRGTIEGDLGSERVINAGRIEGNLLLDDGNDLFDNALGTHIGWASLGWGTDTFIGGAGAERVDGGRMDDNLSGGGGNDLLLGGVTLAAGSVGSSTTAFYNGQDWDTRVEGVNNAFFQAQSITIEDGRAFTPDEEAGGKNVCLLGTKVREAIFPPDASPVGAQMRLGEVSCQVIGLVEERGQGGGGSDDDDTVYMPLKTVQRRFRGNENLDYFLVKYDAAYAATVIQDSLVDLLRERRLLQDEEPNDFNVIDTAQVNQALGAATGALTAMVAVIASISLLVGGIGIMNIMLVSVTERTREIGIRLAIGALAREVRLQFLTEAVVLCALGGLVGIALGFVASIGLAALIDVPFAFDPFINIISFLFAAAMGIVFGYYPASRASKLDPIDALRHE